MCDSKVLKLLTPKLKQKFLARLGDDQFMIQHTVFIYSHVDNGWFMTQEINDHYQHGQIESVHVEISNEMKLEVCSYKGDFNKYDCHDCHDNRGQSTDKCIYAVDLFPDFIPQKYTGEVWIRGSSHNFMSDDDK